MNLFVLDRLIDCIRHLEGWEKQLEFYEKKRVELIAEVNLKIKATIREGMAK